ncbi:Zinc fingers and homeoboxes protein 2 [Bagarius yarrelli]|uniref:Zinc fingers and homeoboxes protein 2 n=1 Tax=Bagarius yarrelli TaxID=175774 RepID=A0A556VUD9_BAGYA|nr:Zinc fingers and homeoboxes protein 2 [Bagarius yarrelli]
MASRRKSTIPCMIRADDLLDQGIDECVDGTVENGSSCVPANENWADKTNVSTVPAVNNSDKPEAETQLQKKVQGGYECKYCTFSTQNINEFKEHVDLNHPNSNFKFKRIKLNSQTILEQTIEGSNCTAIYDARSPPSGEDLSPSNKSMALRKPKTEGKRLLGESQIEKLSPELSKKQITAVNVNGTVLIPDTTLKDGLSHIMPSLQRPPNYSLVPKIAVPLNTSKYNASLDGNLTLITSFNKFPYPTQAELSWLTAASKHPEEQIKVWFTTQRLKQGISWSPEEVEEARKKMFNGTIQPIQQTFTVLPAQLTQSTKASQSLIQTVPCQVLGQSGLVLTPLANGSSATSGPLALTVSNQAAQAVKRPLISPVASPEVKRPSIIQTVQTNKSASPTHSISSDCKKTPGQIKELIASYTQCQFPDDEEVYRLIEMTGLSWGEIKKWFSDQRLGNHKTVLPLRAGLPLKENQPQKPVATKFPLLEWVKGKSSEQMKMLEECLKTSIPSQAEIENLAIDTRLSKPEIDGWFTERRALRDNLEQALLNSMGFKRLDRGALNGIFEQEGRSRSSSLPTLSSVCPEIDSKSLYLLKEVFSQTQWPSPEEYSELELQTGLPRTEIVRWFKNNRSALRNGTLDWMDQFENLSNKKNNGQGSLLNSEPAHSVLQRNLPEAKLLKLEDDDKLAERSKLVSQDIVNWVSSKLGHNMQDLSRSKDQHGLSTMDSGRWVTVSMAGEKDRKVSVSPRVATDLEVLTAEHTVTG